MSSVADQMAPWIEALKEELRSELLAELGRGEWINQEQGAPIIGRVKFIRCCRQLVREGSTDAHYNATTKVWWLRSTALNQEIARLNQRRAERFELEHPPVSKARALGFELESDDDTGIYERELLRKWGAP